MNGQNFKNLKIALIVFSLILVGGIVLAQNCTDGSCLIQPEYVAQTRTNGYEWRNAPETDKTESIYLYKNGVQVGGWSYKNNAYSAYDVRYNSWGEFTRNPPFPLPVYEAIGDKLFGVDRSKFSPEKKCTHKGKEISIEDAIDIIQSKIPDDFKNFRFTVIGTKEEQNTVKALYSNLEPELRARINPWYVSPDNFALKDTVTNKTIFKTDGHPTIYFQTSDGKVLHRQDNWKGTEDFVAIRKAVKTYDDSKDPDLRKPVPPPIVPPVPVPQPNPDPLAPLKNLPMPILALIGVGLAVILVKYFNIKLPDNTPKV